MAEELTRLDGPYEILELKDGEVKELRVKDWSTGTVTIYPNFKPTGKVVKALRVHVPEEAKEFFPYYWDITGQTLVAQMLPYLQQPGYRSKVFEVTKHGVAPKARFTLKVRPA